jgi:hypothetical protein
MYGWVDPMDRFTLQNLDVIGNIHVEDLDEAYRSAMNLGL